MMKPTTIFPTILICLDFGAAIVYAIHGEYAKAGYWVSAASISLFAINM